jgi:hypothetical protein
MTTTFIEELESEEFSDFLLLYVSLLVFYAVDLLTRLVSLQTCRKFVHILNFLDDEGKEEGTPVRKSDNSFLLIHLTVGVTIAKRVCEIAMNYSYEHTNSYWGLGAFPISQFPSFLSDVFVNLRAVYIFAITMTVGLELLQCYEQFCTEFQIIYLHINNSVTNVSVITQLNRQFVKIQRMLDMYLAIAGDYALLTIANTAFDFIYYAYSFGLYTERNFVNSLGVIETLLILYCFAFLGNHFDVKV